jgi:2-polyprenyl-6-methoxyphenol hydroxylase-like FAD-dependent oxidoreductase
MTMRIVSVGGGPGGLFSAILLKKTDPSRDVTVYERNAADDTFGFGVVFSQETRDNIQAADPQSLGRIAAEFRHWSAIDVDFLGATEARTGTRSEPWSASGCWPSSASVPPTSGWTCATAPRRPRWTSYAASTTW